MQDQPLLAGRTVVATPLANEQHRPPFTPHGI